jgi:hypothetical protein
MKTRQLIAVAIASSAFVAVGAGSAERYSDDPVAVSTKARAEVRAELAQARADGSLMNAGESAYVYESMQPNIGARGVAGSRYSTRTRAEVQAELAQARADGMLNYSGEAAYLGELSRPSIAANGVSGWR